MGSFSGLWHVRIVPKRCNQGAQKATMTVPKMAKRDYYEVLGIDRKVDQEAIKRACRDLAMKCHPDRNSEDAQVVEWMKGINETYALLGDTHKRRLYDTYGHAGLEGYTQEDIFRGVDFSSFGFRDFLGFRDSRIDSLFSRMISISEKMQWARMAVCRWRKHSKIPMT